MSSNPNVKVVCCLLSEAAMTKAQEHECKTLVNIVEGMLSQKPLSWAPKGGLMCINATVQGDHGVYHVSVAQDSQSTDVPHPGLKRRDLV